MIFIQISRKIIHLCGGEKHEDRFLFKFLEK